MKLDFKRIMSAILALTMMVSSLVMVNVVSVSAAETPEVKIDELTGGKTVSQMEKSDLKGPIKGNESILDAVWISTGEKTETYNSDFIDVTVNVDGNGIKESGKILGSAEPVYLKGSKMSSAEHNIKINVKKAGKIYIDYAGNGSNDCLLINDGEQDYNAGTTGVNSKGIQTTFKVNASSNYTLKYNGAAIDVYAIGFESDTSAIYDFTGNCKGLKEGDTITFSKDGNTVCTANVNADNSTYKAIKRAETAPFEAGTTLDVSAHGYTVVTSPSQVTLAAGTGKSYTASPEIEFKAIKFEQVLNADDITHSGTLTEDTILDEIEGSYFKIISSNVVSIGSSKKTFLTQIGNLEITKNIKLGGANVTERAVSFQTAEDGDVYVYAMTSSNGTGRKILLHDDSASGSDITATPDVESVNDVAEFHFKVTGNHTYSAHSNDGGMNIYYIGSTAKLKSFSGDSGSTTTYTFKMGAKGDNTDYPDVTFDPSTTTSKTGTVTAKWNANKKYKEGQKVVTLQAGWFSDEDSSCTIPYDQISKDFVENTEPATELKPIPLGTKVAFGSAPTVTDEKTYKDMVNKNDEYTSDGYFQYYINQLDPTAIRVGINESTDNYIKFTPETDCYVDINFEDNDMVMTGDDDSSVDVFRSPKTAGDPITRTLYVQSGVTYTLKRTKLTESGNAYIHTMYFHDITTRLGVGNYTVENGKEITVNLATRGIKDDNLGIKDYDIMVVYDANKLTYESTESVPAELTISPDPSANAVNSVASMTGYEYIDIKANNSGTEALSNDVLAKIKFKAKAVGKAPVLVFVTSINATTEMPPYVVVDGSVTVSETAPTTGDNILKIAADNSVTRDNLQAIYNITPSDVTLFSRIVGTVGRNKNQLKNIDEVGITVVKTDDFEAWKNNGFADDSKILGNVAVDTVYKDVYNVSGNIADLNTGKENNEANTYFDSIVYADTSVDSNSLTACAYTVIQGVKSYYNKSGETSTVVITNN